MDVPRTEPRDRSDTDARVRALEEGLGERYRLKENRFDIAGRELLIYSVGNSEEMLDRLIEAGPAAPAYRDERIPYWAEVWPSAAALSAFVLGAPGILAGARAIEIGCGLGLAGVAAMAAGAEMLFTDYEPDALRFVQLNALLNLGRLPSTLAMDWRRPGVDGRFDVVLASDVAYEKRSFAPLIRTLEAVVSPTGVALVAEPGRAIAEGFVERLLERGWRDETSLIGVGGPANHRGVLVHALKPVRVDFELPLEPT